VAKINGPNVIGLPKKLAGTRHQVAKFSQIRHHVA
jgi:hypothetical protein